MAAKNRYYRDPVYLAQPMTGTCHLCGGPADTRDHLWPGGPTKPACRSCNSRKARIRLA